jgi:hypothetical protein
MSRLGDDEAWSVGRLHAYLFIPSQVVDQGSTGRTARPMTMNMGWPLPPEKGQTDRARFAKPSRSRMRLRGIHAAIHENSNRARLVV